MVSFSFFQLLIVINFDLESWYWKVCILGLSRYLNTCSPEWNTGCVAIACLFSGPETRSWNQSPELPAIVEAGTLDWVRSEVKCTGCLRVILYWPPMDSLIYSLWAVNLRLIAQLTKLWLQVTTFLHTLIQFSRNNLSQGKFIRTAPVKNCVIHFPFNAPLDVQLRRRFISLSFWDSGYNPHLYLKKMKGNKNAQMHLVAWAVKHTTYFS